MKQLLNIARNAQNVVYYNYINHSIKEVEISINFP